MLTTKRRLPVHLISGNVDEPLDVAIISARLQQYVCACEGRLVVVTVVVMESSKKESKKERKKARKQERKQESKKAKVARRIDTYHTCCSS